MDEQKMLNTLDSLYNKALDGIPMVSKSVDELVDDYMKKESSPGKAAKALIKNQIIKCGTSGFLSGLGGALTLAVTLPANITSVLYVQLRMIAAIAKIGGYDLNSDRVQTLVYVCLTGSAAADVFKQAGIKVGNKFANAMINKIPGKALTAINQKVGFRLITKYGTKGAVNLVKVVPVAGGIVGGAIAENAYKIFIEKA